MKRAGEVFAEQSHQRWGLLHAIPRADSLCQTQHSTLGHGRSGILFFGRMGIWPQGESARGVSMSIKDAPNGTSF